MASRNHNSTRGRTRRSGGSGSPKKHLKHFLTTYWNFLSNAHCQQFSLGDPDRFRTHGSSWRQVVSKSRYSKSDTSESKTRSNLLQPNFVQTIQRVFTQSRISAQLHYCLNVYGTKPRATETDSLDTRQYCRRLSNKSAERVTPPLWWRQLKKAVQPVTLQDVASAILERERTKLGPLNFEDSEVSKRLYLPNEQLGHLAAKVYGNPAPEMPHMSPLDAQTYENAL